MKATALLFATTLFCLPLASAQWIEQAVGYTRVPCPTLGVDVVDSEIVWAIAGNCGTGDREFSKTTNGGVTWVSGTMTGSAGLVPGMITAVDASRAWVALWGPGATTSGAILATTDGGTTWVKQSTAFPGSGGFVNFVNFFSADTGVAMGDPNGGYFEIYTTTNAGTNWIRVSQGNISSPLAGEVGFVNDFTALGNTVWFGTNNGRVYRSTDRGTNWSVASAGLGTGWVIFFPAFKDQNQGLALALERIAPNQVPLRTTDGGVSWTATPQDERIGPIAHMPGTPYYISTRGSAGETQITLLTKDDGANWVVIDTVSRSLVLTSAVFAAPHVGWALGRARSSTEGGVWKWDLPSERAVRISPLGRSFGPHEVGARSDTASVTITNVGLDSLLVSTISSPGTNFSIMNKPVTPLILRTFDMARFGVVFTPQTAGTLKDSIAVNSNDVSTPTVHFGLSGRGVIIGRAPAGILFAASTTPNSSLYSLNTATGAAAPIGSLGITELQSLAIRPSSKEIFGVVTSPTSTSLYRVSAGSGDVLLSKTIPVGNLRAIRGYTLWRHHNRRIVPNRSRERKRDAHRDFSRNLLFGTLIPSNDRCPLGVCSRTRGQRQDIYCQYFQR